MKISKGSMLLSLYKKDIMSVKFESCMILLSIIGAYIYVTYKLYTSWHPLTSIGVSTTLFFLSIFIILIGTFTSIRREWTNNTIYLMMSLPVNGKFIFLSKLLTIITQLVIIGGITALLGTLLSFFFIDSDIILSSLGFFSRYQLIKEIIKFIILAFLWIIQIITFAFFSSMIGCLFKKYSGIITFITFVATNIAIGKFMNQLRRLVPPIKLNENLAKGYLNASPVIPFNSIMSMEFFLLQTVSIIIVCTIFFLLAAGIYDKKVEL